MTERATVFEYAQLGIESTAGSAVAATARLGATSITWSPDGNIDGFGALGYKFDTIAALGREWARAPISGYAAYNDLAYLFASNVAYGGTPSASGGTYTWTFTPTSDGPDTVKTYTVEEGSSVRAHKVTYGLVNTLELSFDREKVEISGEMIGQRISDGITLTAGTAVTEVAAVPMLPTHLNVYVDTTSAGLGGTKLTRVLSGRWRYADRFNPLWAVNSADTSWTASYEKKATATFEIEVEADAAGMAYLTNARAGDTRFIRLSATGPAGYSMNFDIAGKIAAMPTLADRDGLRVVRYTFHANHDVTWDKAFTISLVNSVTF